MEFQISPASPLPIYRQLVEQIRGAVARGKLRPGDQLPSVRELSRQLVVNPNTIARVYGQLEAEGVLHARQGLGVFVAPPKSDVTRRVRRERLLESLDRLLTEAVHLGFSAEEVLTAARERASRFQWTPPDSVPK